MQTQSKRRANTKVIAPPPRASQRDRKRAAIITAAKEMFFAQGYAGASMDQITARSGVSKATVYAHFGSKGDLLLAVVEDVIQGMRAAAATDLPHQDDFRQWLTQFGRLGFRQFTSPAAIALQRIAIAEAERFPEIAQAFRQTGADTVLAALVRPTFDAAIAKGVLRKCDARLAISHFFEMCVGKTLRDVLMGLSPPPGAREIETQVERSVEAFLHGYAAK
ncbi:MAG: TetR/AcrR family transcriptional regulator [Pseudomonadota bacterium]